MFKIMIVEDDLTIAGTIADHLGKWGYEVACVTNFRQVADEVRRFEPHLVLLDIMLPFFNGFHWCSEIRKFSGVPIVFLSSAADQMNIVMAMNMGGDDFINKPFDLHVLTAKVGALLRRAYSLQGHAHVLEHNGVVLNLSDATLAWKDKKVELTRNDFRLVQVLMENAGRIVSREDLMQRLWENDQYIDDNTLTVNMARLRKKLAEIGLENWIVTKKGLGYMVE